jgi:hypothetical protein
MLQQRSRELTEAQITSTDLAAIGPTTAVRIG